VPLPWSLSSMPIDRRRVLIAPDPFTAGLRNPLSGTILPSREILICPPIRITRSCDKCVAVHYFTKAAPGNTSQYSSICLHRRTLTSCRERRVSSSDQIQDERQTKRKAEHRQPASIPRGAAGINRWAVKTKFRLLQLVIERCSTTSRGQQLLSSSETTFHIPEFER
jgi:hypothetical protein